MEPETGSWSIVIFWESLSLADPHSASYWVKEQKKGVISNLTVPLKLTLFLKQNLLNSIKIYPKQEILKKTLEEERE